MNLLKYEREIELLVNSFGAYVKQVLIVPNIQSWCLANGVEESSLNRTGKCLQDDKTGKHLILLKREISESQKESIISAMELRGTNNEEIAQLCSPKAFVMHLVLHECAHALYDDFSELECDEWAFKRLREIEV